MAVQNFKLPSGQTVTIEVGTATGVRSGGKRNLVDNLPTLDPADVINPLVSLIDGSLTRILAIAQRPSEVEFSAGLKIGVEGGVIVAKGSAEANINVSLKYTVPPKS